MPIANPGTAQLPKCRTVDEVVEAILGSTVDRQWITNAPSSVALHQTLGKWIRNRFKLWEIGNPILRDASRYFIGDRVINGNGQTHLDEHHLHPDVASDIIIQRLRNLLASRAAAVPVAAPKAEVMKVQGDPMEVSLRALVITALKVARAAGYHVVFNPDPGGSMRTDCDHDLDSMTDSIRIEKVSNAPGVVPTVGSA